MMAGCRVVDEASKETSVVTSIAPPEEPQPFADPLQLTEELTLPGPWFTMNVIVSNTNTDRVLYVSQIAAVITDPNGGETVINPVTRTSSLVQLSVLPEKASSIQLFFGGAPSAILRNRLRSKLRLTGWFLATVDDAATEIDETETPQESYEQTVNFRTKNPLKN